MSARFGRPDLLVCSLSTAALQCRWLINKFADEEEEEEEVSSRLQVPRQSTMPSAPSTKKANAGPGYYDLIKEAVLALKERTGSSRQAIDKYVAAKKGASYQKARLNIALKKGVEAGKLVAVKGSFKLAADEKKAPKVVKKAVKPAGEKKKKKKTVKKAPSSSSSAKKVSKPAASKPKKSASAAKPKAASKPTKKTTPGASKKVSKTPKKVSAKKPTTTKKKVVKKSAAKKVTAKKQE